jgi:hypothetical protein
MTHRRSAARVILDNSLLLLAGTVAAVAWANIDHATYDHLASPAALLGERRGDGVFLCAGRQGRVRGDAAREPARVTAAGAVSLAAAVVVWSCPP